MITEVAIDVSAITPHSGGAGTYVHELVAKLPGNGVAPVLVTRRSDRASWPNALRLVARAPQHRPLRLAWEQVALRRVLRRRAPEARLLHSPHYTMPLRAPLSRRVAVASVVTIHDLTFFTHPDEHDEAKRLVFRRAIRYAARHADALVCVSDRTARELNEHVRVDVPVSVISHGIDHRRFAPPTADTQHNDTALLRSLALERPFVLFLGTISPRKNVANLLRAYELLCRDGLRDIDLVLAGGAWPGQLDRLPAVSAGRVHQLGFVPHELVAPLYRAAAVVAYPSLSEGFGLPVLEALACGAPVVTTSGSVMEELAADAVIAVDPLRCDAIATGLRRALDGVAPPVGVRLTTAARYSWEESARCHADLYGSMLDGRGR